MNLTTATPVEIDTRLKALYEQTFVIGEARNRALDSLHYAVKDVRVYGPRRSRVWKMSTAEVLAAVETLIETSDRPWDVRSAKEALAKYTDAVARRAANNAEQETLNAEYQRRGGWTRAFLAVGNGMLHVHSSMFCSSCNKGLEPTRFDWRTEFSGKQETDVVEAAGERACTVCYPTAPVAVRNRPTTIFSPDEIKAQQAREERAAAKVARDAKKIEKGLTPDGSEFVVTYVEKNAPGWERNGGQDVHVYRDRERTERFKTEQAAVQWVVQYVAWGDDLRTSDKAEGFAQVIEAVAQKHGKTVAEVTADIEKKVAAKIKRDSR